MPSTLRDTFLHLRPRSWPIVFAHFAGGSLIALAHAHEITWLMLFKAIAGGVIWAVFLNGGTLALNSAFDADEGSDIGYLDNPPPAPPMLAHTATNLMVLGMAFAFPLSWGYFWVYCVCFMLSLAYSVPPLRFKAVPGMDLLINMAGYGAFNFLAGALAPGTGLAKPGLLGAVCWLSTGFAFLFAAFYPMTQIYQIVEDAAKGDRTLAVRFGTRRVLALSIAAIAGSGVCQLLAAWCVGVSFWGGAALLVSNGAWMAFTIDWLRRSEGYPSQRGMYRALKLWAISDLITIAVFAWAA
jgi:4-hydroxybenzoate polyprenyltransferase